MHPNDITLIGRGRLILACRICGTLFRRRPSDMVRGPRFCGRQCQDIARKRLDGLRHSPEYNIWNQMRQRCLNPRHKQFQDYGGRGITVCQEWRHFSRFYADMGPRPSPHYSIERTDNNGPYSPENCVWSTPYLQTRNKRNNRYLAYMGLTLCVADWEKRLNMKRGVLGSRLLRGWPVEDALSRPLRRR
jgi:hypothetical protein